MINASRVIADVRLRFRGGLVLGGSPGDPPIQVGAVFFHRGEETFTVAR